MSDSRKTAVIFGLANKRSIAWAIAQKLQQAGWRLAITYQNERLALEAKDLIADLPGASGFTRTLPQTNQSPPRSPLQPEKSASCPGLVTGTASPPTAISKATSSTPLPN